MDVVFDSTYLIDLLNPKLKGSEKAALDNLIDELNKSKSRILIPAPCMTELLIHADKASNEYLRQVTASQNLSVLPFDTRAATECALLLKSAWGKKMHRGITKTKFKFDWMIVACAASRNIPVIYSDDEDIARGAAFRGIRVVKQSSLRVPAAALQRPLPYDVPLSAPEIGSPNSQPNTRARPQDQ